MNDPTIMKFFAMLDDYRHTPEFLRRVAGIPRKRGDAVAKLQGRSKVLQRVAYLTPAQHEAKKKSWREDARKRKERAAIKGASDARGNV